MSVRDQILHASGDFKSETVDVPEWGVKLVIREMSLADRGRLTLRDVEQVEVAGGWALKPRLDTLAAAHIVVATAYDESGEQVFTDDDAAALAEKAFTVIDRLARVARRLSGIGTDYRAELQAILDRIDGGADLNEVHHAVAVALDEDEQQGKAPGNASTSPIGETSSPSPTT